jgi:S1-C subfamily serine protease
VGFALTVAVAAFGDPAAAQKSEVPLSRDSAVYSFAPVVKKAAPAVVNVYVRARVQTFVSPFADDPLFRRFFGESLGMPAERIQNSLGSGVIVSPMGIVVTNTHVIKIGGATEIKVGLADRREFDAKIILQDEKSDIAVLRIEGGDGHFPYLEFENSDKAEVGDLVLAIGNPFGVGQTVTSGIVSALARTEIGKSDAQVFIQTDAAINPGNSGGALIDMAGRVVGINTAIYSRSGGSHGVGFAIPSNMVKLIVDSAVAGLGLAARVGCAGRQSVRQEPGRGSGAGDRRCDRRRRRLRGCRCARRQLSADDARHWQQRTPQRHSQGTQAHSPGGIARGAAGRQGRSAQSGGRASLGWRARRQHPSRHRR